MIYVNRIQFIVKALIMTSEILDGKKVADTILEQVKVEIKELVEKSNIVPTLSVINVGDNPASKVYISKKELLHEPRKC